MDYIVECQVECPYCGAVYETTVDTSQSRFSTIEDCEVCCRPIQLNIECEAGEVISVSSARA